MQVQNFVRPMIQNWKEYQSIKATSLGAGSAVIDRDFANITKDNAERLKQLRIQASNASLSFGQALQPALNAALSVLVPLITKISEFVANNPNFVSQIVMEAGGSYAGFICSDKANTLRVDSDGYICAGCRRNIALSELG